MHTELGVIETVDTVWEKEMNDVVENIDLDQEFDEYADEEVADNMAAYEKEICKEKEKKHNVHDCDSDLKEMLIAYLATEPDSWKRNLAYEKMKPQLDKLISYVGHKYFTSYMKNVQERDEMYECGHCGIIKVINEYDPTKAMPFSYFFHPILHELQKHISFVHENSSYDHNMFKRIEATKAKLASRGIVNPSIMTVAIEMGVRPSTIRKQLEMPNSNKAANYEDCYLNNGNGKNDPYDNETDDIDYAEASDYGDPFRAVIQSERNKNILQALDALSDVQRACVRLKFGFESQRSMSYTDISARLGLPVDTVKRSIQRAINEMKMNPHMNAGRRANRDTEIKHGLNYEPFAITPDNVGISLMNTMDDLDSVDSFQLS